MIKLHGHPLKSQYDSQSEWPFIDSQGHWKPSNDGVDQLGHLHFGIKAPIYGEITELIRVPFKIQMFRIAGALQRFNDGEYLRNKSLRDIVFNETGTNVPPTVNGDPNGLVVMEGMATIDLSNRTEKGWIEFVSILELAFDNGDAQRIHCLLPLYSMRNPNAVENNEIRSSQQKILGVNTTVRSARSIDTLGNNWVEMKDYLPIGPLSSVFPTTIFAFVYGGTQNIPVPGFTEYRKNPALHDHNPGELLARKDATEPGNPANLPIFIDPLDYGEGTHLAMFKWTQTTGEGNEFFVPGEEVNSLITFPIIIGDAPEPEPEPEPQWTDLDGLIQQSVDNPKNFRFVPSDGSSIINLVRT